MQGQQEIIVFQVRREADGLFVATSEQLEGVYVAHRELNRIVDDIPNIIRLWFESNRNVEVEIFRGPASQVDDIYTYPSIPVPVEVAAQAMRR